MLKGRRILQSSACAARQLLNAGRKSFSTNTAAGSQSGSAKGKVQLTVVRSILDFDLLLNTCSGHLLRHLSQLTGTGAAVAYQFWFQDVRSTPVYAYFVNNVAMPALRSIDAERAHTLGIKAAALGFAPRDPQLLTGEGAEALKSTVCGLEFRNPIGLAAGFDKQAEAMDGLLSAGFGFVEVGTVTPLPQPGNPLPRMFRLPQDKAVINRFGFNSDGGHVVAERLAEFWSRMAAAGHVPGRTAGRGVVGVNIGKNKEGEAVADYTAGTRLLAPFADYLTVNISSPNTPGLRSLQGRDQLHALLSAVIRARDALPWGVPLQEEAEGESSALAGTNPVKYMHRKLVAQRRTPPPIWVKIAPDLTPADMEDIAAVVLSLQGGVGAVIVTNTTIARPESLKEQATAKETGGLSGQPLFERSTEVLRAMHGKLGGRVALIGVGGVATPEQAAAKLQAGASLVQVYTALAYEGPTLVPKLKHGLLSKMKEVGVASVLQLQPARSAAVPPSPSSKSSGWW